MVIEKWLSNVQYDKYGTHMWNVEQNDGMQMIADVRGWGAIQHLFKTEDEASKFQDEVGKFITEAIREKIERLKNK